MNIKLKPALRVNSVDVTSVNDTLHTIHMTVHIVAQPFQVKTPEFMHTIHHQVHAACEYLRKEGYIDYPIETYLMHTGVVLHDDPNNYVK